MTGPLFSESGSSVSFMDPDKVDMETDKIWITGIKPEGL